MITWSAIIMLAHSSKVRFIGVSKNEIARLYCYGRDHV